MTITVERIREVLNAHEGEPIKLSVLFQQALSDGKLYFDHLDFYRLGPYLNNIDFSDCVFTDCDFSHLEFNHCTLELAALRTNNNNLKIYQMEMDQCLERHKDWSRLMWSTHAGDLFQYAKLSQSAGMYRSLVTHRDSFFTISEKKYDPNISSLGWKMHISVNPEDLEKAFDLAAPILCRYFNTFKVRDLSEKFEEHHRLKVGAQITVYLQENGKTQVSPLQAENMMREITAAFKENNIRAGILPASDAQT